MAPDPSPDANLVANVVFVHGFTSSPAIWDNFLRLLTSDSVQSSFELLAFGYPTGLLSLNPKRVIPSIEACAESLDSYLARHVSPSAPLILISHSQGGLVFRDSSQACSKRAVAWNFADSSG